MTFDELIRKARVEFAGRFELRCRTISIHIVDGYMHFIDDGRIFVEFDEDGLVAIDRTPDQMLAIMKALQ